MVNREKLVGLGADVDAGFDNFFFAWILSIGSYAAPLQTFNKCLVKFEVSIKKSKDS